MIFAPAANVCNPPNSSFRFMPGNEYRHWYTKALCPHTGTFQENLKYTLSPAGMAACGTKLSKNKVTRNSDLEHKADKSC